MPIDFDQARFAMIEQQVRPWEVLDPRVLDVLARVRREDFVLPRHRKLAFADLALPLEHGESMMKPVVEGRTLQALLPAAHESVLEVGTGSGYLAACLGRLAREVVSLEIHADLADLARARLASQGAGNVQVVAADALAWDAPMQFDAVCVTGAVAALPARFVDWLKPGGRVFAVTGRPPAMEAVLVRREVNGLRSESLFETDLPYLAGAAPRPRFVL